MQSLFRLSAAIDRLLTAIAKVGAWASVLLVLTVCYDVTTRYFSVPKFFGLNSTKIQESEYWIHTYLFALTLGYAYIRQAHVRIDLVRDRLPIKVKYLLEIIGIVCFLMTYVVVAVYFTSAYAHQSYLEGELSKSVIGLSHIWVLKIALPTMFILLGLAGISQLVKAVAGYRGLLPPEMVPQTLGGDL